MGVSRDVPVIPTKPMKSTKEGFLVAFGMTRGVIPTESMQSTEEGSLAFASLRLGMTVGAKP